jgi:hypothetical protein
MLPRDEDLISYLLGEADPRLQAQVEQALRASLAVAKRLDELRLVLGMLDQQPQVWEPPPDLIDRTLARIDLAHVHQGNSAEDADTEDAAPSEESVDAAVHPVRLRSTLAPEPLRLGHRPRSKWDSLVLGLSLLVLCSLFLPTILSARFEARRDQCAYNLRQLGEGLIQLAMLDSQRRFPQVDLEGPRAFAGSYALHLQDAQLLGATRQLICPSLPQARAEERLQAVPTSLTFSLADDQQQQIWRRQVGGSYAYNLGVTEEGRVLAPQLSGRSHFAILSDAPEIVGRPERIVAHEGRGINLFYEDGHVRFLRWSGEKGPRIHWASFADHPFRNLQGDHAVGLAPDDAVLGPSQLAPLEKISSRAVDLPLE